MYQLISYTKLDSTSTFKKLVAGSHDLAVGLNNSCFSFLLPIISYILNCGKICTIVSYPPTTLPHAPHWAKNGNIITITRYINCLFLIRNTRYLSLSHTVSLNYTFLRLLASCAKFEHRGTYRGRLFRFKEK